MGIHISVISVTIIITGVLLERTLTAYMSSPERYRQTLLEQSLRKWSNVPAKRKDVLSCNILWVSFFRYTNSLIQFNYQSLVFRGYLPFISIFLVSVILVLDVFLLFSSLHYSQSLKYLYHHGPPCLQLPPLISFDPCLVTTITGYPGLLLSVLLWILVFILLASSTSSASSALQSSPS